MRKFGQDGKGESYQQFGYGVGSNSHLPFNSSHYSHFKRSSAPVLGLDKTNRGQAASGNEDDVCEQLVVSTDEFYQVRDLLTDTYSRISVIADEFGVLFSLSRKGVPEKIVTISEGTKTQRQNAKCALSSYLECLSNGTAAEFRLPSEVQRESNSHQFKDNIKAEDNTDTETIDIMPALPLILLDPKVEIKEEAEDVEEEGHEVHEAFIKRETEEQENFQRDYYLKTELKEESEDDEVNEAIIKIEMDDDDKDNVQSGASAGRPSLLARRRSEQKTFYVERGPELGSLTRARSSTCYSAMPPPPNLDQDRQQTQKYYRPYRPKPKPLFSRPPNLEQQRQSRRSDRSFQSSDTYNSAQRRQRGTGAMRNRREESRTGNGSRYESDRNASSSSSSNSFNERQSHRRSTTNTNTGQRNLSNRTADRSQTGRSSDRRIDTRSTSSQRSRESSSGSRSLQHVKARYQTGPFSNRRNHGRTHSFLNTSTLTGVLSLLEEEKSNSRRRSRWDWHDPVKAQQEEHARNHFGIGWQWPSTAALGSAAFLSQGQPSAMQLEPCTQTKF